MNIIEWVVEHAGQIGSVAGPAFGGLLGAIGWRKAVATQRTAEAKAEEKISTRLMGRVEKLEGKIETITKQRDDVTGQFASLRTDLDQCKRDHEACTKRAEAADEKLRANNEATLGIVQEMERLAVALNVPREPVDRLSIAKIQLRSMTPRSLEAQPSTVVLVVDDDEPVLRALLRLVDAAGHIGLAAGNATEALSVLAENRVDVVLSDVCLPGQSGPDLMATMRAAGMQTPVIFVTGQPAAKRPGVLEKPIDLADLQQAISEALRPSA